MTDYQCGVLAGLQIGAPGVARMYERIIHAPGISLKEANGGETNDASKRLLNLERLGVVRSEMQGKRRACYPVGSA